MNEETLTPQQEKIRNLQAYLYMLYDSHRAGHFLHDEIDRVLGELRKEMGIDVVLQ